MEKNHLRKATSEIHKNTWYEAIIARNASGLTIRDWCRENGVNETSYYYWLKKIRIETLEVHDTKKEANLTFVPMLQPMGVRYYSKAMIFCKKNLPLQD